MNRNCPIIALEGLSGTGKTTVGKLLADKTGGVYFHCKDNNPLEFSREYFNKIPQTISFFFYILYFSLALKRAERLAKRNNVFMDNSVIWVYSHFKAHNLSGYLLKLLPNYLKENIDVVLFFTLDEKERVKRVETRMKNSKATDRDIESIEIGKKTKSAALEYLPDKTVVINTNNKNPNDVAERALELLKQKGIIS